MEQPQSKGRGPSTAPDITTGTFSRLRVSWWEGSWFWCFQGLGLYFLYYFLAFKNSSINSLWHSRLFPTLLVILSLSILLGPGLNISIHDASSSHKLYFYSSLLTLIHLLSSFPPDDTENSFPLRPLSPEEAAQPFPGGSTKPSVNVPFVGASDS